MKLHYFQHEPFEGIGMIAEWAAQRGHTLVQTAFFAAAPSLPALSDYDALIIMGGSMGVYDEDQYPWLVAEKAHIRAAITAGLPVLGICLGAQLIAASLGAKVAPQTHKEIGWFPVAMTEAGAQHPLLSGFNSAMTVYHWHGDRFELPAGAVHLMSSAACDNQAFLVGARTVGLQFHLEMDAAAVQAIVKECGHELEHGPWIQSGEEMLEKAQGAATRRALYSLLDRWIKAQA